MLSLFFPLPLVLFSNTGAGSEGFPVPRLALASSAAVVAEAWDCCITLNSLTTAGASTRSFKCERRQKKHTSSLCNLSQSSLALSSQTSNDILYPCFVLL